MEDLHKMTQGTCQLQPGELVQVHVEGLLQPAGGVPADQVLLPRLTKTKVSNKLARISPRMTEDKRSLWIFIAGNKDSPKAKVKCLGDSDRVGLNTCQVTTGSWLALIPLAMSDWE